MTDLSEWAKNHIPDPRDTSFTTDLKIAPRVNVSLEDPPMSAVDAYREFTDVPQTHYLPYVTLRRYADAAINELDANAEELMAEIKMYGAANGELKDALDKAEAKLDLAQRPPYAAKKYQPWEASYFDMRDQRDKAEAELAALKAAPNYAAQATVECAEYTIDGLLAELAALKAQTCLTCIHMPHAADEQCGQMIGWHMAGEEWGIRNRVLTSCSEWEARP